MKKFLPTLSKAALVLGLSSGAGHLTAAPARAEFKLVTVDVNRILNESKGAKGKRKELEELTSSAKKKIEDRRKPLAEMESKLKASKVDENSKEADKFRSEVRDYQRFAEDTEKELRKKFLDINKTLTEQVIVEIQKYAKDNEISMVLDKSEKGRGPVLFGAASADITDEIIKVMNSK